MYLRESKPPHISPDTPTKLALPPCSRNVILLTGKREDAVDATPDRHISGKAFLPYANRLAAKTAILPL